MWNKIHGAKFQIIGATDLPLILQDDLFFS